MEGHQGTVTWLAFSPDGTRAFTSSSDKTARIWDAASGKEVRKLEGHTEAVKGVTVFLGLMVTFGSSGLVNQIMNGFMLTYSRAVRLGDFVRIGDVEGTVMHLGVLSAKLKTPCFRRISPSTSGTWSR